MVENLLCVGLTRGEINYFLLFELMCSSLPQYTVSRGTLFRRGGSRKFLKTPIKIIVEKSIADENVHKNSLITKIQEAINSN